MAAIIVYLECITNMHVGNGDVNYNIIDNEVERDAVTGYPTINSSGVKGALREYFVKNGAAQGDIDKIFGKDKGGELKFLNADIIALPVRASAGEAAYYLISTGEAINRQQEKELLFLKSESIYSPTQIKPGRQAEGIELHKSIRFMEKDIYLLTDDEFRKISLPVLARNKLDDGKSVNLWYEEVVPYRSLFSFAVLCEDASKAVLDLFIETVNNKVIQFGGNASIGYGLCKVTVQKGECNEQKCN